MDAGLERQAEVVFVLFTYLAARAADRGPAIEMARRDTGLQIAEAVFDAVVHTLVVEAAMLRADHLAVLVCAHAA